MSTKDQAWAERVGREAVELGMPKTLGLAWVGSSGSGRLHPCDMPADDEVWPDFRDRLTELACIAWVEDVAREVYGMRRLEISVNRNDDGTWDVVVSREQPEGETGWEFWHEVADSPTLAEACIAAVRAMKGGE